MFDRTLFNLLTRLLMDSEILSIRVQDNRLTKHNKVLREIPRVSSANIAKFFRIINIIIRRLDQHENDNLTAD
jgi:hypothetical protein